MEDLIHIKVKENDQGQEKWFEYGLSYEEFAMIQPVLEQCKERRECPMFDPNDPEMSARLLGTMLMPFGQQTSAKGKGIIYNLKDKPKDMTKEQVMDIYERRGFVFVEDEKTETKQII